MFCFPFPDLDFLKLEEKSTSISRFQTSLSSLTGDITECDHDFLESIIPNMI